MTFSTFLTILRIAFAAGILPLLSSERPDAWLIALITFALAGLTDWLDGFLARRWHQTSRLGTLLDPIADKILVLGVLGMLAWEAIIPPWIVWLIALREIIVTAARLAAARKGAVLAAAKEGKWKAAMQMFGLGTFLFWGWVQASGSDSPFYGLLPAAWILANGLLYVSLALTLFSGFSFFRRNAAVLRNALQ